jgi:hypothetical protein
VRKRKDGDQEKSEAHSQPPPGLHASLNPQV